MANNIFRKPILPSTSKSKSNASTYAIKIVCKLDDNDCTLYDILEAKSLVDAYNKATKITNDLSNKVDRYKAFSIESISRKN